MLVTIPQIEFVKGIPSALEDESYLDVNKRNLIVFDNQMINASKDKRIVNPFTRGSHHRNLRLIYLVQNLFHRGKGSRTISLNSHYLVLLKNPRDKLQILTLAKQMYPRQTVFFINQQEEAVRRPFGYLLEDLKATTQDNCRLRTNILRGKEHFNQTGIQDNISQELIKYLRQQNLSAAPVLPVMQQLQGSMKGLLSRTDLGEYDKAKQYLELQNRHLTLKHQLNAKPHQSDEMKRSFASHPEDNLPTIVQRTFGGNSGDHLYALKSIYHDTLSKSSAHHTSTCHTTTPKSIRLDQHRSESDFESNL